MQNTTYDRLKTTAQVGLPASAGLYLTLAEVWGTDRLQYGVEVAASLMAINTFLGLVLGYASKQYNESDQRFGGVIHVEETDSKSRFLLELTQDPDNLPKQNEVLFKIEPGVPSDIIDINSDDS